MTFQEAEERIEALLEKEYVVVDFLPAQVKADSPGQFFAVEEQFLTGTYARTLRESFAGLILRLNCFYDLELVDDKEEELTLNPPPEALKTRILENEEDVTLFIEDSLIQLNTDDTHLTLFRPSRKLLYLVRLMAEAEGLFVWTPGETEDPDAAEDPDETEDPGEAEDSHEADETPETDVQEA